MGNHAVGGSPAWLGIYQTLLWYEHSLPHIIDANELAMGSSANRLVYAVATSEMYDQRVAKLTNQPCADYVVHTHLPLFQYLNGKSAFQGHKKLIDLTKLVQLTQTW